jgi:hypothetical protein
MGRFAKVLRKARVEASRAGVVPAMTSIQVMTLMERLV